MDSLGKSLLLYDLHISVTEQDSEKQKEDRSTAISPQSKPVHMPKHTWESFKVTAAKNT